MIATELLLVGRLWWAPFVAVHCFLHFYMGCDLRTILTMYTVPTLHLQLYVP